MVLIRDRMNDNRLAARRLRCLSMCALLLGCVLGPVTRAAYLPLYSFTGSVPPGNPDGRHPRGSLIQSGSTLYGLSEQGGSSGDGTIFKFDTSTNIESVLYSFQGTDGGNAYGTLVRSGSMLYGLSYGSSFVPNGTLFQYNTTSNTFGVLHTFSGG